MAEQAYGITFAYSTDGGSTYTSVGEVTDISPPSISKDVIETTNHGSSGIKTYLGSLVDYGECSVTFNYDPDGTDDAAVRGLATSANSDASIFKITYSDDGTSTEEFSGHVISFETEAPMDGVLSATVGIKVTGSVTYA